MSSKVIPCRDYKKFDDAIFNNNLHKKKNRKFKFQCTRLCDNKGNIYDKFASLKKKYIRANHLKFVTKEFSKAIMLR